MLGVIGLLEVVFGLQAEQRLRRKAQKALDAEGGVGADALSSCEEVREAAAGHLHGARGCGFRKPVMLEQVRDHSGCGVRNGLRDL